MLELFSLDLWLIFPIIVAGIESGIKVSFWSTALAGLRWMGILVVKLWFWFKGIYIPNEAQCIEPRVFFYANLGAYGGIRIWIRLFLVLCTILSSGGLVIGFWTAFQLIRRALRGEGSVDERLGSHSDNGNDYKRLIGYGAYSMLFSLLGSELQLKRNNLDGIAGVDSTGQILSL